METTGCLKKNYVKKIWKILPFKSQKAFTKLHQILNMLERNAQVCAESSRFSVVYPKLRKFC